MRTLLLILFLSFTAWSARLVANRLAEREPDPLTTVERLIWSGMLTLALWLAQGWVLAVFGHFRSGALVISSVLLLAVGLAVAHRNTAEVMQAQEAGRPAARPRLALMTSLPFVLAGAWITYSAAALRVLPVSNHDALSYHFPKAARLVTSGAFALYPSQDLRVTYFPGNYEMLAATFMTFLRSDTSTGLVTSASLLLFAATAFALFRRMWSEQAPAALALAMLFGSPVLLLHATAHKNDILMAAVTLNALVWLGRFAARGGLGSAVIGMTCVALAVGIKFHGLFLVLASGVLLWRAWRDGRWRPTPRAAALQLSGAAVLFSLLGGVQYIANLATTGHLSGIEQVPTANAMNTVAYPAFSQVPRFLCMFLTAPFLTAGQYFLVPWSGETWFWPAYELYFSHYGGHITVLILLLPVGVRWAGRELDAAARSELASVSLAALLLVVLNALIGLRPYGGFAFIPRFLMFALPVLLVWTWCPWVVHFKRRRPASWIPLAASLAIPLAYGGATVVNDGFTPIAHIRQLWLHPEKRREVFHTPWRAASIVDRLAPGDATVAIDAGYDGWTYPAYGAGLSRNVEVLVDPPDGYVPGPEVDWVAVDYAFSIIWGHSDFQSMNLAEHYIDRGRLSEREMRVFRSVSRNADFKLVYYLPTRFQAVFQRVRPTRR